MALGWMGRDGMGWGGAAHSSAMAEAVLPPARLSISHPKPPQTQETEGRAIPVAMPLVAWACR